MLVERTYIEYFHNDLEPFVHFVPVKRDLSDLVEKATWVKENPEKACIIAQNAYMFAMKNFTKEKICERIKTVYENTLKNL